MNREDLKNYKYTQKWIEGRLEYLESYKESIIKTTNILSDMPKGSRKVQDSMAEKISKLLDNINELLEKVNEENKKQKLILEQLDEVEQPFQTILELHYINGYSLVEVACKLKYNYEYIKKANSIALKKFEKIKNFP